HQRPPRPALCAAEVRGSAKTPPRTPSPLLLGKQAQPPRDCCASCCAKRCPLPGTECHLLRTHSEPGHDLDSWLVLLLRSLAVATPKTGSSRGSNKGTPFASF